MFGEFLTASCVPPIASAPLLAMCKESFQWDCVAKTAIATTMCFRHEGEHPPNRTHHAEETNKAIAFQDLKERAAVASLSHHHRLHKAKTKGAPLSCLALKLVLCAKLR